MAKGKKKNPSQGKYTSKGINSNVSVERKKALRRDFVANRPLSSIFQAFRNEERVVNSPKSDSERVRASKILARREVEKDAVVLFSKYGRCGLKWSAAVQAVKTKYVEKLIEKWSPKLRDWEKKQRALDRQGANSAFSSVAS